MTTVEMHQTFTVRRRAGAADCWCPACLKQVPTVSLEEAALLAGVGLRDICRRVGDGDIHLVETADGTPVCLASLLLEVSSGDGGLNSEGADVPSLPPADPGGAAER